MGSGRLLGSKAGRTGRTSTVWGQPRYASSLNGKQQQVGRENGRLGPFCSCRWPKTGDVGAGVVRCGARYRYGYRMQMRASQAVSERAGRKTVLVQLIKTEPIGVFCSAASAGVLRAGWMRGCVGANQRASEQASGSGFVCCWDYYYITGRAEKGCSSGSGFCSGLGLNSLDLLDLYVAVVWWEGQLRLSADVDGTSMTKDPRKRRGCSR